MKPQKVWKPKEIVPCQICNNPKGRKFSFFVQYEHYYDNFYGDFNCNMCHWCYITIENFYSHPVNNYIIIDILKCEDNLIEWLQTYERLKLKSYYITEENLKIFTRYVIVNNDTLEPRNDRKHINDCRLVRDRLEIAEKFITNRQNYIDCKTKLNQSYNEINTIKLLKCEGTSFINVLPLEIIALIISYLKR